MRRFASLGIRGGGAQRVQQKPERAVAHCPQAA
ncbi:MAG: hypothetical protein QOF91_10 [Alphaproteobacteria bacterium]|nr:hypothetical protein [Alphaproteobacteria bacterium]